MLDSIHCSREKKIVIFFIDKIKQTCCETHTLSLRIKYFP